MVEKINFEVANATSENVNVVNTTSENANVVSTTSENENVANSESKATSVEPTKKPTKKKLDESFKKRITKDGEYRTTYTIKEVDNLIKEAVEYKLFLENVNSKKNVVQILSYAKKKDLTNEQIDELMKEFAAMKTAA